MMIKQMVAAALLVSVATVASGQQQFSNSDAAIAELAAAAASGDQPRLDRLFGPTYAEFRQGQQADPALAQARFREFSAAFTRFHALIPDSTDRYTLVVGADAWPFAIPLVRSRNRWSFDGVAGVEELRYRLVGANEVIAIAVLDTLAAAQHEYATADHDGDGVLEYAMRVVSTPGNEDGLYW